ncbi:MAG: CapA family protein [Gemmatimonadota bacterium]|nr:CapA family protein [Gemmatimonadota bacterium]
MIFLGDVAVPESVHPRVGAWRERFGDAMTVANLEGALVCPGDEGARRDGLYNDAAVLQYLAELSTRVVGLANNHILDAGLAPSTTVERLAAAGIRACGAGDDWTQASRPATIHEDGRERVFLAFGWEAIRCRAATPAHPGVNPLRPDHVLASVKAARRAHPDATLVLLMHWGYELELYPHPMHRQLAFAAVDAGADCIVGTHSHCVQGVETYRGAPIAYGLGNWFLPQGEFLDQGLVYPPFARRQLALEWDPENGTSVCHLFDYRPEDHSVEHVESEPLERCAEVRERTPFAGMPHERYVRWFAANRRKKRLLPVYHDYRHERINRLKDHWVQLRHSLIQGLVLLKLKGGVR